MDRRIGIKMRAALLIFNRDLEDQDTGMLVNLHLSLQPDVTSTRSRQ